VASGCGSGFRLDTKVSKRFSGRLTDPLVFFAQQGNERLRETFVAHPTEGFRGGLAQITMTAAESC
jgi:hypothetical protein